MSNHDNESAQASSGQAIAAKRAPLGDMAALLRQIAKTIEPTYPSSAELLRGQAGLLSEVYRQAQSDALHEAADRIEAEANGISGTGHLRAWWVITRLRQRADRLAWRTA